jgi:hypothetical protein
MLRGAKGAAHSAVGYSVSSPPDPDPLSMGYLGLSNAKVKTGLVFFLVCFISISNLGKLF